MRCNARLLILQVSGVNYDIRYNDDEFDYAVRRLKINIYSFVGCTNGTEILTTHDTTHT